MGAGEEPRKISNSRLFEALKQALEVLKRSHNLIKNLGKKHKIRLESTSFQTHTHTHKKRLKINVFLSLFLYNFKDFGHAFFKKVAPGPVSDYNCRLVKTFLRVDQQVR